MRLLAAAAILLLHQTPVLAQGPSVVGTWQADFKGKQREDVPRTVVVRADSSASYGTETVRWRLKPDSISLVLGGEWVTYRMKLKGSQLTLSGGDLTEPITLNKVGPPTARPDSVAIPPDPDGGAP